MLEVCIDSLESAINAIHGGAEELEVCSSLAEGGLTPSIGLVQQITAMVNNIGTGKPMHETCIDCTCPELKKKPFVNVMLRCRAGSDFCYTKPEMDTMLTDLCIIKTIGVDRFVFGALTNKQEVDENNCTLIVNQAHPLPVTFHRAFDVSRDPLVSIDKIIKLGFNRVLTSGQSPSVDDHKAYKLISCLTENYKDKIKIMPGAGINSDNVKKYIRLGCKIVHSSCKAVKELPKLENNLCMGAGTTETISYADEHNVKELKIVIMNELTQINKENES